MLYVVHCGEKPARVPLEVIDGIRARMDEHGVVELEGRPVADPLFARRERERVRALVKFARAGFPRRRIDEWFVVHSFVSPESKS